VQAQLIRNPRSGTRPEPVIPRCLEPQRQATRKINIEKLAHFSQLENVVLKLHIYHAPHHVFTTEKPRPTTHFSRNPLQKHQQIHAFAPNHHSQKNLRNRPKKSPDIFEIYFGRVSE